MKPSLEERFGNLLKTLITESVDMLENLTPEQKQKLECAIKDRPNDLNIETVDELIALGKEAKSEIEKKIEEITPA